MAARAAQRALVCLRVAARVRVCDSPPASSRLWDLCLCAVCVL